MTHEKFFDDLAIGDVRTHAGRSLSELEIIAFAQQFDPEPFHVDPEKARDSHFGQIVASGAHTFALWRRLCYETQVEHGWVTIAGAGFDEMRLPRPVRPDEQLAYRAEVIEKIPSRSKPDRGVVKTKETLTNPAGELVLSMICTAIMSRRT